MKDTHNLPNGMLGTYVRVLSLYNMYPPVIDIPRRKITGRIVPVRTSPKIGRNDPCPCGSGKKYKKCCINKTNQDE